VNLPALGAIAVLTLGALSSPLLLVWASYCLARPERRMEGASILGFGVLAAGTLLIVGFLTAPPESPGLFRFQAITIVSGVFTLGAAAGKVIHFAASRRQRAKVEVKRTA
jgi:hypothetical protein